MPLRMLRPGIITSEAVNKLSAPAEVFYRRLMSIVDDWGRYDGRVSILRPTCYPLQLDRVREADVQRGLAECEEAGLVRLYNAEGKPYVQMLKWDKPRAKSSKWPDPPEDVKARAYMCSHMFPESESDTESKTETDKNPPTPQRGERYPLPGWFDEIWAIYPNKDGRKAAERHFRGTVKTPEDFARIRKALENYLASDNVKRGFVKNGSTWFNNWVDWENYTGTPKPKTPKPGDPDYVIQDVDRVIAGFRNAKGIPREDKAWAETMWELQRPEAQRLLDYFRGDWRMAVECIAHAAIKAKDFPDWGWKAVHARAPDFKNQGGQREPVRP